MPAALILGAAHLGGAVAERLAGRGYDVATLSRSDETAARVTERLPAAMALTGDATDQHRLEEIVGAVRERFGSIDVAVNAISPPRGGPADGGELTDSDPASMDRYTTGLLPAVVAFHSACGSAMREQGSGTMVQVTGGSALRARAGSGQWAAAAAAVRALTHASALELREHGVHVALLVVDAVIESDKTREHLAGREPDESTTHAHVANAVEFLADQDVRGLTHELQITPAGDRWVP
ncbi:MAG: SDR family oxidoreductase [Solirubrobacterales bacterium]